MGNWILLLLLYLVIIIFHKIYFLPPKVRDDATA